MAARWPSDLWKKLCERSSAVMALAVSKSGVEAASASP
jgi:hypothetical protein